MSRTFHRRLLPSLTVAAALALPLSATLIPTPANADSGSTLHVAADTQITTFNPFLSYYDGELDILGNIYPSLNRLDKDGKSEPYLADSWSSSADKLTWTFKIHPGLKWSDGQPLTAKDAAWTFNLIMTNDDAATANGSLVSNFASVTAPDDTTLVIKTKQPRANMLYVSLPYSGIVIVPEHIWSAKVKNLKNYRNMDFPVVGYGPWKLVKNVTNQYAELDANKDFFLGAPKFDHLISQYFANSDAAVAALKNGQLNQLGGLSAPQYTALAKESNITTYQTAPAGWTGLEINPGARTRSGKAMGTGNPLLKDQKLRTALAYSINRDELVRTVLGGKGIVGAGYWAPAYSQWFWQPSASEKIGFDPAKAKQILDAAGYKVGADGIRTDSTGKRLSFRLGIHSDDSFDAAIAPYLVEWFKAVGVEVKTQPMSFDQLNNSLAKGDWDMLMDGWGAGPDPTYMLSIQTCNALPLDDGSAGSTDAFYCNPEYDKLFTKQLTQFDTKERQQTVFQMLSMLYQANADIIFYYKNDLGAYRNDLVSNYLTGSANSAGFYPLQNLSTSWQNATPVTKDASSGNSVLPWAIGGGVLVLAAAAGGLVAARRRSSADDRE